MDVAKQRTRLGPTMTLQPSSLISAKEVQIQKTMRGAPVEIAAPGARATTVLQAPSGDIPDSKRAPLVKAQNSALKNEMGPLDEGTRARNRELHLKLTAISERGRRWEAMLQSEIEERQEAHTALLKHFDDTLLTATTEEDDNLMRMIERYHSELVPTQEQRMADEEETVRVFVHETVPAVIDQQSGIIGRKLQKAHDTFDIENAKILKREHKIVARFERHVDRTAQSFEDERATRRGKFMLLHEDIDDVERVDDRNEEVHISEVLHQLEDIDLQLQEECKNREKEDNHLLDTMIYAQKKLQHSIIEAFGANAEL